MGATVVDEPGGPEVLRLGDVEVPEPGPGEVLIEVAVAVVNFADVGMRVRMMGGPHAVELPYTPGFEASLPRSAVRPKRPQLALPLVLAHVRSSLEMTSRQG